MKEYRLTQALGGVSDDLLLEASQVTPKRRIATRWRRLTAVAAAVAIFFTALVLWPTQDEIVTGPGLFVVRAYAAGTQDFTEENGVLLKEGVTLPSYVYDNGLSSVDDRMTFMLSLPDETYEGMEITFECILTEGSFRQTFIMVTENLSPEELSEIWDFGYPYHMKAYLGDHFTVKNHQKMVWVPYTITFDHDRREYSVDEYTFEGEQAFACIVVRADNHIVGYVVLEIYGDADTATDTASGTLFNRYYARVLKAVSFPQVNGRFQKVSIDYVNEQFVQIQENA